MVRTRKLVGLTLACTVALWGGCSDDDTGNTADSRVTTRDSGPPAKEGGSPTACTAGECWEYVVDKTIMPLDTAAADKYAVDYKGKRRNNLGQVLIALAPTMKDTDMQASLSESTCQGANLVLLRMMAKALGNASGAKLQMWVGEDKTCCDKDCYDKKTKVCVASAKQKCFNGGSSFNNDKSSKGETILAGKISGGKVDVGPGSGKLVIPTETANLVIPLEGLRIRGTITADKITDGILNGGIPVDQIKTLYPPVAKIINAELKKATGTTAQLIKDLLDTNKDGTITAAELENNTLLAAAFSADIKVKNKAGKEIDAVSLGVGFTAIKAKLNIK